MTDGTPPPAVERSTAPDNAKLVLLALILVAAVANLNLAVANVALPDIGKDLDASQTGLDLVAVGYSLGLAASVLYLGALGDRYGRKRMLHPRYCAGDSRLLPRGVGTEHRGALRRPALRRSGRGYGLPHHARAHHRAVVRARTHASRSRCGRRSAAPSPPSDRSRRATCSATSGGDRCSCSPLPLAVVALVLAIKLVPAHVNETVDPVDNLGGILSVVLVAGLVLSINFAPVPGKGALALGLAAIALAALIAFYIRQRRARFPLYDLDVAARRTFWVAACAGIIVFGSLMGAMFIGQQFLQNVLDYSPIEAGASILPAVVLMVIVAPRSAKLVEARGARFTLLLGYVFCLLGFVTMLVLWEEGSAYWQVGLAYAFVGTGVGFAGTPASHSLTSSVPVTRAGMASGTADLQRDLGGAIMQSILGALLAAGYATAFAKEIAGSPNAANVSSSVENQLTKSFGSAIDTAQQYPQYSKQITAAAQQSFVDGAELGLHRGHHRDHPRRDPGLVLLPEGRRREADVRGVSGRGQRRRPRPRSRAGSGRRTRWRSRRSRCRTRRS